MNQQCLHCHSPENCTLEALSKDQLCVEYDSKGTKCIIYVSIATTHLRKSPIHSMSSWSMSSRYLLHLNQRPVPCEVYRSGGRAKKFCSESTRICSYQRWDSRTGAA